MPASYLQKLRSIEISQDQIQPFGIRASRRRHLEVQSGNVSTDLISDWSKTEYQRYSRIASTTQMRRERPMIMKWKRWFAQYKRYRKLTLN